MEPITTAVEVITIPSDRIVHHTEADLIDRRIPKVIRLVQYDDTLPIIAVDLKAGGVNYALPSNAACNIRVKKTDGTVIYNPAIGCDSTRSVAYFEATRQMCGVPGELQTVLEVIVIGKVAGTSPLRIVVEENPVKDDDYESESETQTIIALVGEAEQARDDAQAAAETAAEDAVLSVAEDVFKGIASYEQSSTASKAYAVGDYVGYNGKLYRVTTAISSGGTISPGTNCTQTTAGDQITDIEGTIANKVLWFSGQAIASTSGSSGTLCTITNSAITADHVLQKFVAADNSYITSDITCTTSAGQAVITGTSTAATTAEIMLIKKDN